ncbi:MAG: sulfotransferase family protein, partial [Primorskyibacter sp.]
MSKPNIGFFVVGAARSGTTSLYAALGMHPDVYCPEFKEPRFFRGNQDKGWDWYASLYADATEGQILGDFSPNYMDFDRGNPVAEKIAEHYPDARIVYIVRNPISCAISNWQMGCDVFEEIIPFEEAYTGRMRGSVLLRSKFALQYKLLKRVIPKKQILVLPLEGLATTPG